MAECAGGPALVPLALDFEVCGTLGEAVCCDENFELMLEIHELRLEPLEPSDADCLSEAVLLSRLGLRVGVFGEVAVSVDGIGVCGGDVDSGCADTCALGDFSSAPLGCPEAFT